MLVTDQLKTIPLTIHVPLKDVPALITKDLIYNTIKILIKDLNLYFGINKPRILVTGLNPHAGENGDIGFEENEIIIPAILEAKKNLNCSIIGPVSADSAFTPSLRKQYDVAICMYHDQALIPIKTLDFFNGVNITLGIDFIRTSPDHGTGFEIAGKNIANAESLISSIKLAYEMSLFKEDRL
jgi:4-hydroxythreonine-4-phosphate dehydrogenase